MKRKKYSLEQAKSERTGTLLRCQLPTDRAGNRRCANLLSCWVREAHPGIEKAFPETGSLRDEELSRLKRELAE